MAPEDASAPEDANWKPRLCMLKKLSPVADCLHLLVYKESSGSKKHNKEKASILLEKYCGVETGYQVDKEQNVLAILCVKQVVLLAFHGKNTLIDWLVILREHLGHERVFHATLIKSPPLTKLQQGPVRLFIVNKRISLISQIPPVVLLSWLLSDLRKFGALDSDKFCLEGGTRAGTGNGLFAFLTDHGGDIEKLLSKLSLSGCQSLQRRRTHTGCLSSSSSQSSLATLSPRSPLSPIFTFPPTQDHHQQKTNRFSTFGDLGVSSSEIQRCLDRQRVHRSISEDKSNLLLNSSSEFLDTTSGVSPCFIIGGGAIASNCDNNQQFLLQGNENFPAYENVFPTSLCDNNSAKTSSSIHSSSSSTSHHNLPIAHGHSKSLGCEPEIYMDLSDILRKKTKQQSSVTSSSTGVLTNDINKTEVVSKLTPLQKAQSVSSSIEQQRNEHTYANDLFINQVNSPSKSHGGTDLLTEILKECKLDQAAFKAANRDSKGGAGNFFTPHQQLQQNHPLTFTNVIESGTSRCQVNVQNSNKSSQFPCFIELATKKPQATVRKEEHSYCNFPLEYNDQTNVDSSIQLQKNNGENNSNKNHNDEDDKKLLLNGSSCSTEANYFRSLSKTEHNQQKTKYSPATIRALQHLKSSNHVNLSCSAPNVCDTVKLSESQELESNTHFVSTMKSSNKKGGVKRNSRSLPDFDPLRPLEFVDLSRFDGKDEGYLYRVKTGPHPQVIPATSSRGYDNIPKQTEACYANVNMQKARQPGQQTSLGYDNIPSNPGLSARTNAMINYDNLAYSSNNPVMDNITDLVKAKMEYENLPFHQQKTAKSLERKDNDANAVIYQNWSKSAPAGYTAKNNLLTTNVPPPVPPKSSSKDRNKKAKDAGSKLPFGGTFALHGSLRRPKPLHREVPASNYSAGDIAGTYVMLKGDSPKKDSKKTSSLSRRSNKMGAININSDHMGVTNLATSANFMLDQNAIGLHNHTSSNDDVELVILEMSADDPQRDNIANMLAESQQRPVYPVYGRTGPPQPLPPRRFSFHAVTTTTANTTNSVTVNNAVSGNGLSLSRENSHGISSNTQLDLSHNSAFTPLEKRNGNNQYENYQRSSQKSATVNELVNGPSGGNTYGSSPRQISMQQENTKTQQRIRSNEYIDMSQPFRSPRDRSISPDARTNASVSPQRSPRQGYRNVNTKFNNTSVGFGSTVPVPSNGQKKVGDSPYMDMGFMMYANNKSPLSTPEKRKLNNSPSGTPEKTYSNVGHLKQNASSLYSQRKLHHSKSLDNELDEVYIDSDILDAVRGEHNNSLSRSPVSVEKDQQYLPMSTINKHMNKSPEIKIYENSGSSSDEDEEDGEKPLKPFDGLLDLPPYTEKKTSLSLSPKKSVVDSKSSKVGSGDEDNISIGSGTSVSSSSVRRGSKGGLFARLMRRNSSAKDLAKMSAKSEEDILEADDNIDDSLQKGYSKEPIYAQIPENGFMREPVTLPLKKKSFSHKSTDSLLLDPVVQNERIKLLTGKVCLEHGNLTDEQKQSRASLLSERSMTPPTPPPNIPLPAPPLPPPRTVRNPQSMQQGDAPLIPRKTYKNRRIPSPLPIQHRKPEPEYVDIEDDDFPCGTGRETPASLSLSVSPDPPRIIDGVAYLEDGRPVPPPRPPSCSSTNTDGFSEEESFWSQASRPKPLPQVQRSLSLRSNHERFYLGSHKPLTEPSSPMRSSDNLSHSSSLASPLTTVLRPRTGKQYSAVDRKRWLEREDYLSSGPSSGSQTPASPLCSPTKSPGSSQSTVFNFDSACIKMSKHHHHHRQHSGSDTDSPRSPSMLKPGFRDPDHVYMNLTFPKSPRSASPVVIDTSRHRTVGNMADYANIVLNYAEIDLSRSGEKSSRKTERALNKSNIDYAMIDMVATAAASQASKNHQHARERGGNLRQKDYSRNYRRSESNDSKENSSRKGGSKDRNINKTEAASSSSTSSSPLTFGKDKKLGRSNSAVSRVSTNSVDRKHSLPV